MCSFTKFAEVQAFRVLYLCKYFISFRSTNIAFHLLQPFHQTMLCAYHFPSRAGYIPSLVIVCQMCTGHEGSSQWCWLVLFIISVSVAERPSWSVNLNSSVSASL